jgi:hypothetical protein
MYIWGLHANHVTFGHNKKRKRVAIAVEVLSEKPGP